MTDLIVHPAEGPLSGSVPIVADKSITHRALLLAALASGRSVVRAPIGGDNRTTIGVLTSLGVRIEEAPGSVTIDGVTLHGLRAPGCDLDCQNSGTTARLIAGILAAQRFTSVLTGDATLCRRPMERVARPLRLRGARIEGRLDPARPGESYLPLTIGPLPEPHLLGEVEIDLPIASAQIKSALLLSGLYADGPTYVREPTVSRDHTERMLLSLGVPVRTAGAMVALDGATWSGELPAFEISPPGDVSAAAFILAAAALVPGSNVSVRRVGTNPTRGGILEILRDMGASLAVEPRGDELSEPIADLHVQSGPLTGVGVGGELTTRAIDEIPIACALMANAAGTSRVTDAAELRVKESDRLGAMASLLRAFGVEVEEHDEGLTIEGSAGRPVRGADVESRGDHRIAMTAAVLGLRGDRPTRIRDADCIATSFPRFVGTLRALGARIDAEAQPTST